MSERYEWCPGNGTRYDLIYDQVGNKTMITWMLRGGSGGTTMLFSHFLHHSYVQEKLQVGVADAVGILKFLEHKGHEVGYPDGIVYERCEGDPFINRLD